LTRICSELTPKKTCPNGFLYPKKIIKDRNGYNAHRNYCSESLANPSHECEFLASKSLVDHDRFAIFTTTEN
jgi:hypothetical protein